MLRVALQKAPRDEAPEAGTVVPHGVAIFSPPGSALLGHVIQPGYEAACNSRAIRSTSDQTRSIFSPQILRISSSE